MSNAVAVNRHNKCPICNKATWCLYFDDEKGGNICMRVPGGKEIRFKRDGQVGYFYQPAGSGSDWTPPPIEERKKKPQVDMAPIEVRDTAYRLLLQYAGLTPQHREHLLIERRLPESDLCLFGSLDDDSEWRTMVANDIARSVKLKGVPGFYRTRTGDWSIAKPRQSGMMIAAMDQQGRVQGLQVRMDVADYGKYRWLSSDPEDEQWDGTVFTDGAPGQNFATYPNFTMTPTIWVAEGILKALVCSRLSNQVFVGFPGARVGDIDNMKVICQRMTERFILCPDADFRNNLHVYLGWKYGYEALRDECGAKVRFALWDESDGKGLDDVLMKTGKLPDTVSPKVFFELFTHDMVKAAWDARQAKK